MKQRLTLLLTLVTILSASCSSTTSADICNIPPRSITETSDFKFLWSKSDIFVTTNSPLDASLYSLNSMAIAMVRTGNHTLPKIMALDMQSGTMIWQKKLTAQGDIVVGNSSLYMGIYDHIQEYDPQTGDLIKATYLPNVGNIYNLYINNKNLYAFSGSGRWLTFNLEDQTSDIFEPFLPYTPYIVDNGILYLDDNEGYQAVKVESKEPIWKQKIDEALDSHPLFTANMIFVRSIMGNVYALNKESGDLMWKSEQHVISNLTADSSRLYFLTADGYLKVLNINDGQEVQKLEISSTPFETLSPGIKVAIGSYNIWVDAQNKTIIFSLGDSCQIIALRAEN